MGSFHFPLFSSFSPVFFPSLASLFYFFSIFFLFFSFVFPSFLSSFSSIFSFLSYFIFSSPSHLIFLSFSHYFRIPTPPLFLLSVFPIYKFQIFLINFLKYSWAYPSPSQSIKNCSIFQLNLIKFKYWIHLKILRLYYGRKNNMFYAKDTLIPIK